MQLNIWKPNIQLTLKYIRSTYIIPILSTLFKSMLYFFLTREVLTELSFSGELPL